MHSDNNNLNLYLVYLGGRATSCHTEIHDIRWVVGQNIEDTYAILRREWIGNQNGLHIDGYMKIKYIDGFEVQLEEVNSASNHQNYSRPINRSFNYLWFINLGGYDPNKLTEMHEFILVVATNEKQAKDRAKRKLLQGLISKHVDDIHKIDFLESVDGVLLTSPIYGWRVSLVSDPLGRSQNLKPDWYGYQLINKSPQKF